MEIKNIGIVIEGGGMRGIFTAGVLDYLMEKDINFPYVIGVSMGACNGSAYVAKQIKRSVRIPMTYLDDWRYLSLKSYLKEGNLFGMDFIFNKIPYELDPFDFETFEKSSKKFISVATSCETGKARYFEKSDMTRNVFLKSLEASTSLPFLSTMKEIDGEKLLDGGISDSIPVLKVYSDGYKKQVVILTREYDYIKKSSNLLKLITPIYYRKYPELAESIINRADKYNKTLEYIKKQEKAGNYFVIRPLEAIEMPRVGKDKDKLKKAYDLGYNQMEALYNDLKIFLER